MGSGLANNGGLGRFDFNGRYASGGVSAQPAHQFADFLMGYPSAAYRSTTSPNLLFVGPRNSFFVQDDWRVSSRLSMNFGVRYMYQVPWYERNNTIANFDFATSRLIIHSDTMPSQAIQKLVSAYPIVMAKDAGFTSTGHAGRQEQLRPAHRFRISSVRQHQDRDPFGLRRVLQLPAGVHRPATARIQQPALPAGGVF